MELTLPFPTSTPTCFSLARNTPTSWLTPLYLLVLALDCTSSKKPSWSHKCVLECTFHPIIIFFIFICMLLLTYLCLTVQGKSCSSKTGCLSLVGTHTTSVGVCLSMSMISTNICRKKRQEGRKERGKEGGRKVRERGSSHMTIAHGRLQNSFTALHHIR